MKLILVHFGICVMFGKEDLMLADSAVTPGINTQHKAQRIFVSTIEMLPTFPDFSQTKCCWNMPFLHFANNRGLIAKKYVQFCFPLAMAV